jgi:hypothetical protein
LTGRPLSSDASAVVIVTPALGPSFGDRARGDVHVELAAPRTAPRSMPELLAVGAHVGERDPRGLLHDVAELAVSVRPCPCPFIALASMKARRRRPA